MRATISAYLPIISLFVMAVMFSGCDSGVTDSTDILSAKAPSANAVAAYATFQVQSDVYTASSGTVTVTYLGEAVQANYTSTWTPLDVAATLVSNINNDNDIQLDATITDYMNVIVRVEERRTGEEYNGNPVYLNDSIRSNHIKLSDSVIYLDDGED